MQYRFSVRALTVGAGAAAEARARTGPQPGSPAPPAALRLRADPAALHLRWTNAASGKGPLLGYYFEARKKGTVSPRARFLHSAPSVRNASRTHYYSVILDSLGRKFLNVNLEFVRSVLIISHIRCSFILFMYFGPQKCKTYFIFHAAKETWQACKCRMFSVLPTNYLHFSLYPFSLYF